jgi:hypothetical protein
MGCSERSHSAHLLTVHKRSEIFPQLYLWDAVTDLIQRICKYGQMPEDDDEEQ